MKQRLRTILSSAANAGVRFLGIGAVPADAQPVPYAAPEERPFSPWGLFIR